MKKIFVIGGILFAVFVVSGCATLISGTHQKIKINSQPPGAKVIIEDTCDNELIMTVTTPAEVKLSRSRSYHLRINKKGYYPVIRGIGRKANPAIIVDLALLPAHWVGTLSGMISAGVDHFTGAIWVLSPKEINVELKEIENKGGE